MSYQTFNDTVTQQTTSATPVSVYEGDVPENAAGTIRIRAVARKSDNKARVIALEFCFRRASGSVELFSTNLFDERRATGLELDLLTADVEISTDTSHFIVSLRGIANTTLEWAVKIDGVLVYT